MQNNHFIVCLLWKDKYSGSSASTRSNILQSLQNFITKCKLLNDPTVNTRLIFTKNKKHAPLHFYRIMLSACKDWKVTKAAFWSECNHNKKHRNPRIWPPAAKVWHSQSSEDAQEKETVCLFIRGATVCLTFCYSHSVVQPSDGSGEHELVTSQSEGLKVSP